MTFRSLILSLLLATGLSAGAADSPGVEQRPVFAAKQDGYHTYRIPAVVVTTNGTILAFCEARKDGGGDAGRIDLVLRRSTDGGKTWSAQQVVWSDGRNTCGNPAPVVDQATGTIWLLMTWNLAEDKESAIEHKQSKDTRRVFVTSSTDDGKTWASPQEITSAVKKPEWGWYATGPVNGIQLTRGPRKGRLVIPANHSRLTPENKAVSLSHVIYSDDHGKTWQLGGVEEEGTNESTIAELSDGCILQNMRTYKGMNKRAVARSNNAGASWSPVQHDETLIEPVCQGCVLRATWPGQFERSRILFSNPASLKREKMTVRVSYNEGTTWDEGLLIHAGPSAYSSLVMLPNGTVGLLFEKGEKSPYETITFATFPLSALSSVP